MIQKIQMIYNTLDLVEVKGHNNTGYLSSAMSALQSLAQEAAQEEKSLKEGEQ